MPEKKFYFDDPEGDALAKETCHPSFVQQMTADFYYDCTNDFSPFGNDDGADLLFNLEDFYREKKGRGKILKWLFSTIDDGGYKYESEGCSKITDAETLQQLEEDDPGFFAFMDNSILAAAFGQIKIAGLLDPDLRQLAVTAIQRQLLLNQQHDNETVKQLTGNLNIMLQDLNRFA